MLVSLTSRGLTRRIEFYRNIARTGDLAATRVDATLESRKEWKGFSAVIVGGLVGILANKSRRGSLVIGVRWIGAFLPAVALAVTVPFGAACSQAGTLQSAAEQSDVIVRGRVLRTNASDDPLVPPSGRTAVLAVLEMYAGSEIAGDQKGRNMTVILSRPGAVKSGEQLIFFGKVRSIGTSMTIADQREVRAEGADTSTTAALSRGIQARKDRPIRDRLAVASLVFRGVVQTVRPLEPPASAAARQPRTTEHDPEWNAATVRIVTPFRGGHAGDIVTIIFAGSRDIVWVNSPKLTPGEDAVFLPHTPTKEEELRYRSTGLEALTPQQQPIYLVTEPYDVLPNSARIRTLLTSAREE